MQVENYTQNLADYSQFRNNGRGGCGLKQVGGTISRRACERIIREAKRDFLDGFGIDWSLYDEPSITFYDMLTCQIEWTHKTSGKQVHLTQIFFDKKTGRIDQAGSNYGNLTL
jgi:hypothetical protein